MPVPLSRNLSPLYGCNLSSLYGCSLSPLDGCSRLRTWEGGGWVGGCGRVGGWGSWLQHTSSVTSSWTGLFILDSARTRKAVGAAAADAGGKEDLVGNLLQEQARAAEAPPPFRSQSRQLSFAAAGAISCSEPRPATKSTS